MKTLSRWLSPLLFWVTYRLFRLPFMQQTKARHDWVMKLFRFAADNDCRQALSVYGHLLHFRGEGEKNRIQGALYLERAAALGDVKAQYQMGRIYETGFAGHFQPSPTKALSYYQAAAEQGHALAIKRMVTVFAQGELEMSVDEQQAQCWRQKQPAL